MYFALMDSTANLVESFSDLDSARAALLSIVQEDPEAAEHLAILSYTDDGEPAGTALTVADLRAGI